MMEQVPSYYIVLKMVPYLGLGDPEAHLKAFRAQMLISRVSDACSMQNVCRHFQRNHFAMVQWDFEQHYKFSSHLFTILPSIICG